MPIIRSLVVDYDTEKKREAAALSVSHIRMTFDPNDINYVIIQNDSEISCFINILREANKDHPVAEEVDRLVTRIITTEQIMTDF